MKRLSIKPLDVLMFRSERPFIARESHVAKLGVISPLTFEGAIKSKIFMEFCKENDYSPSDFQRRRERRDETMNDIRESLETLVNFVREKMENNQKLSEFLEVIGHPLKVIGCDVNKLLKVFKSSPLNYPSKLNVLGVFFAENKGGEVREYFPIPNDIMSDENEKPLKLKPILKDEVKITGTEKYACFSNHSKVESIDGLISFDALIDYLHGEEPNKSWFIEKPYELEVRTGIKLEKGTKRTVEGHLYTAEFLRLKLRNWEESWGFTVWVEDQGDILGQYFKGKEIIRLGGESKGAICEKISNIDLDKKFRTLIEKINVEKRFKLYLATPSYFNGHKPPKDKLEDELGVKLALVAAFPGKPVYIGGYDFALNKEKSLRRWVNVGAVYYYKFNGQIKEDLSLPIKILDKNIDMRCAFIGRW